MLTFILNDKTISTDISSGMTLLDFIRFEKELKGTKIGCREGDCGACTVLIGEVVNGQLKYQSVTSCLTPIANVAGKHVVSIEGLNMIDLSPIQLAMVEESGTQCGFCTVGFILSFSALYFSDKDLSYEDVISGIDGNICRCTGYKSIERAAQKIHDLLLRKDNDNKVNWLVENNFIPKYFRTIQNRLKELHHSELPKGNVLVGGGTDLYVQKHEELESEHVVSSLNQTEFKGIAVFGNLCSIGGATTVSEMMESAELNEMFPSLQRHLKLVSSTPIRNIGTIAGNFVNASPIGDLTIFFLALDSQIVLKDENGKERTIYLKDFYLSYKTIDKNEDEVIIRIQFYLKNALFNFEKVSKRSYLDIASVNSALSIQLIGNTVREIHLSAGGVGPIPHYLIKTCDFIRNKELSMDTLLAALEILQKEIYPISDVRGSDKYKRLLLRQLFFAHFVELFPNVFKEKTLL